MMPVLKAQDALEQAERMAVGAGHMKPEAKRKVVQRWQKEATLARASRAPRATPEMLSGAGIGYHIVERT